MGNGSQTPMGAIITILIVISLIISVITSVALDIELLGFLF